MRRRRERKRWEEQERRQRRRSGNFSFQRCQLQRSHSELPLACLSASSPPSPTICCALPSWPKGAEQTLSACPWLRFASPCWRNTRWRKFLVPVGKPRWLFYLVAVARQCRHQLDHNVHFLQLFTNILYLMCRKKNKHQKRPMPCVFNAGQDTHTLPQHRGPIYRRCSRLLCLHCSNGSGSGRYPSTEETQ